MEVEKPHPHPLHPPPRLAQLWGFRLPLGIYGVRCWGWSIPLRFSRGRVPRGQATGRPGRFLPGDQEARRCRRAPHPSQVGPLGSRLRLGQQEHGVGKACPSALSLVSPHPSLSWHPLFLSLLQPPGANIIPFSSFSSLPTPYPLIRANPPPPHPPPRPGRSPLGKSFHLSQSFAPCSKC